MFSNMITPELGVMQATVTSGRGLNVDELTQMALAKIIFVGPDVPPAIRDQAEAYKVRIEQVLRHYINQAQKSQNTSVYNHLMSAGHPDAAEIVRKL